MTKSDTIAGLGGREDYVGVVPNLDRSRLGLGDDELTLLALIGRATVIKDVLERCGLPEAKAIATLLALRAKGVIVPAKVTKPPPPPAMTSAASQEEIDLDEGRKAEILAMETKLEGVDHFAALGLEPGAPPEEVKRVFYEASKKFHPDRFFGKNLGSFKSRIERIFRRLTEAQNVLSDLDKRNAYLKANPHLLAPPKKKGEPAAEVKKAVDVPKTAAEVAADAVRDGERRSRLARHPYLAKAARVNDLLARAKAAMARGDFGHAFTDLHMASQMDERNTEVKHLLGDARKKSEVSRAAEELKKALSLEEKGELAQAVSAAKVAASIDATNAPAAYHAARLLILHGADSKEANAMAQRAVELDGQNAEYRIQLAKLLDDGGMRALAKKHWEEAARLKPDHDEVKKQVKKRWPF